MANETPRPLSQAEADAFAALAADVGPVTCSCQYGNHRTVTSDGVLPYCGKPAVVQVAIHLVHVCRHPRFIEQGLVDHWGNATQLLCAGCLEEMRQLANAKIAQTRAKCTQLSTSCQRCGTGMAVHAADAPGGYVLLDNCVRCGFERIHFEPACGAGVKDKDGNSHGCGAPLVDFSSVIRSTKWLDNIGGPTK